METEDAVLGPQIVEERKNVEQSQVEDGQEYQGVGEIKMVADDNGGEEKKDGQEKVAAEETQIRID